MAGNKALGIPESKKKRNGDLSLFKGPDNIEQRVNRKRLLTVPIKFQGRAASLRSYRRDIEKPNEARAF